MDATCRLSTTPQVPVGLPYDGEMSSSSNPHLRLALVATVLAGCGSDDTAEMTVDAAPGSDSAPTADAPIPTLKVMTFNIKSGRDSSLEAVAQVILDEAPDLVALQEVDVDTMRTGMVN